MTKTNEEVKEFNDKLEEDAKSLRDAGIDAKTTDPVKVVPIPDAALDAIAELRKDLEGTDTDKNVGRLEDVIVDFNKTETTDE